jgi:hypothetical protein
LRNHGALIMENFISFPALNTDDHRTTFGGHWKDYHSDPNVDPRPFLHALLIVGVGKVDDSRMGGVVLFVVVGLDLLRSMEVKSVVAIDERVTFDSSQFRRDSLFPAETTSASPATPCTPLSRTLTFSPARKASSSSSSDKNQKPLKKYFQHIDLKKVSHMEI